MKSDEKACTIYIKQGGEIVHKNGFFVRCRSTYVLNNTILIVYVEGEVDKIYT